MVETIVTYTVTDAVTAAPVCRLTVSSNEPQNGSGDGDTAPDWKVVSAARVELRPERAGHGSGRVYTVTVSCFDSAGNSTTRQTAVQVPKGK